MESPTFSFIHCADLHLDSPFVGINAVEPRLAELLRDSTFDSFETIVTTAIERAVDFVLIAGDVYDSAEHSLRAQIRFRDSVQRLCSAGIPCYMIHGNHDPLNSWDAKLALPENAYRFGGESVEKVTVSREGERLADIYGISFPTREVEENLALQFHREGESEFAIGLLHCNVGGKQNHDNYAPCSLEDLKRSGIDYWALGHVHTREILSPMGPSVVYPGNIQGRSVRETGARGCYHVNVDSHRKVKLEFVSTEQVRWFGENEATLDVCEIETMDELLEQLHELKEYLREKAESRPSIGRIAIEGRSEIHSKLNGFGTEEDLLVTLRDGEAERQDSVWIESLTVATRRLVDIDQRRGIDDFVGDFLTAADRLRGDGSGETIRQLIMDRPESQKLVDEIAEFSADDLSELLEMAEQMGLDDLLTDDH